MTGLYAEVDCQVDPNVVRIARLAALARKPMAGDRGKSR